MFWRELNNRTKLCANAKIRSVSNLAYDGMGIVRKRETEESEGCLNPDSLQLGPSISYASVGTRSSETFLKAS